MAATGAASPPSPTGAGVTNYRQVAAAAAKAYGINPAVFSAQINQESGFDPTARSGAGAEGIAQFMPSTAAGYGVNPMNPTQSLYGAAKMDAQNIQKYGGWAPALSAYNSGNPTAYEDPSFANGQTYNYVRDILGGQDAANADLRGQLPIQVALRAAAAPAIAGLPTAVHGTARAPAANPQTPLAPLLALLGMPAGGGKPGLLSLMNAI